MEDDIVKILRERERILGEFGISMLGWMDAMLRDAFNSEAFLRYAASFGIDLSQYINLVGKQNNPNPYRILGLEKTATNNEVKKRYREMLFKFHPDTAGIQGTSFLCQKITDAYQQIQKERGWKQ
jgi:DnaJ-domain-containing protein 1